MNVGGHHRRSKTSKCKNRFPKSLIKCIGISNTINHSKTQNNSNNHSRDNSHSMGRPGTILGQSTLPN
jgi:hypothetical protein